MASRVAKKVTSTTTLTAVSGMIGAINTDHISVINKSDGDVEVYADGDDLNPAIICPTEVYLAFDNFIFQGQLKIKNSTGTGGDVYLHIWKEIEK
jgi:hypothetical protein